VRLLLRSALALALVSCGTYFDPGDDYARGLRLFDRGDFVAAADLWRALAVQGDCDAEARYGYLLFAGSGVQQDQQNGIRLLKAAGQGKQPFAAILLGLLYADGKVPSPRQLAATINDTSATPISCSVCGIDHDFSTSYVWFRQGQRSAIYDGQKQLGEDGAARMSLVMSSEQIRDADAEVAEWQAKQPSCHPRHLL
jgi:TPR repeat protein